MKKKLIILLILTISLFLISCEKNVEKFKETLTKPYVETLVKNNTDTVKETNQTNDGISPTIATDIIKETTVPEEILSTNPGAGKLVLDKTFYNTNDEIKTELIITKPVYLEKIGGKTTYSLYRFADGEFKLLTTGGLYECYNDECNDNLIYETCEEKPSVTCEKTTDNQEADLSLYEWVEYTKPCEGSDAVKFLEERRLTDGIYKLSYTLHFTSRCIDAGTEAYSIFAIKN